MGVNLAKKREISEDSDFRKKRDIVVVNGIFQRRYSTALEKLEYEGHITKELFWAGDRLYRTFQVSGLAGNEGRCSYEDTRGISWAAERNQETNELIYRSAIIAVHPLERDIIRAVACYNKLVKIQKLNTGEYSRVTAAIISKLRRGLADLEKFWDSFKIEDYYVE